MNKLAILCIDDEIIVLDSLKEQLEIEFADQYIIETAENGTEALEIAEDIIHDKDFLAVVIADFIMPGMKGDELLEKIHKQKPDIRNILLTGQASLQGISNAVNKAGLYRFISKPWDKNDLVLTVREAIRSYEQNRTILKQNDELKELNTDLELKVEQRTQELRELNATKDKFFSIIAHDLKNPFNTLMGFSELMLMNMAAFKKEQIQEYINIIFTTSKNTYSLLENLLDWSHSQTGRIQMDPGYINLSRIVEENVSLMGSIAEKKGVMLVNNVDNKCTAYADENMIKTVVRNLISNAIKFTPKGGEVTVSYSRDKDKMIISVTDTGVGIKPENLEKLFRIDVNFTLKGTDDEEGTGLGLILCKEFITRNKGEISVKSTFGKGSEFSFGIPAKEG